MLVRINYNKDPNSFSKMYQIQTIIIHNTNIGKMVDFDIFSLQKMSEIVNIFVLKSLYNKDIRKIYQTNVRKLQVHV